ncbi:Phosphonoacetaldehyde hydrolase [compost metagenome]
MSLKLCVFDMAGTTVVDRQNVHAAFIEAMADFGYNVTLAEVNPLMGYKKTTAILQLLNIHETNPDKITVELIDSIHEAFEKYMVDFYATTPDLHALPFAEDLFNILKEKGIKVGLNTGFSRKVADVIVERLGWKERNLFDYLVASDEVEQGRPYPYMIRKMMDNAGVKENEVAKVGDTEVDINEGINTGCLYVIGVTTGAFTREELLPYKPTHIIDSLKELEQIFFN